MPPCLKMYDSIIMNISEFCHGAKELERAFCLNRCCILELPSLTFCGTYSSIRTPLICRLLLEKGMATHSSILAWRIPWTEEPGRPWPIGLQNWTWLKWLSMYSSELGNDIQAVKTVSETKCTLHLGRESDVELKSTQGLKGETCETKCCLQHWLAESVSSCKKRIGTSEVKK